MKRVALVYDRLNKWGGAERLLLSLHDIFPEAPLFTSLYDPDKAPWASVFPKIHTSFLQKFAFLRNRHEFLGTIMPIAFEQFNFDEFDLVVSVTSEAAKGIVTKPETKHLCICLTPTRYLWSHYDTYFKNKSLKALSLPFVSYLKRWDKIAAQRPDKMVAISKTVSKRIKRYYGLDSEVIYPPVWKGEPAVLSDKSGKYYLVVSRLVGYKRVELAIGAFNELEKPLVIVGEGAEGKRLKQLAKNNIEFVGSVNEEKLLDYYKGAKALIMPQEEDFGLVSLEAQSMGVPVVAYKKGGAGETVVNEKTGIFFKNQNVQSLLKAVKLFEGRKFDKKEAVNNARKFSQKKFKEELQRAIDGLR